jgi:DNA-binding LacI/PurR family transcriptional regulator
VVGRPETAGEAGGRATSVDLEPDLLAKIAVTTLVNRLEGLDRPLPVGEVRGILVVRESTRR